MSGSETPDVNRGPTVVGILWAETAVAAIIVAMRFCARTIIKKLSWDDWLMLVALEFLTICAGLTTAQSKLGGYRHTEFLSTKEIIHALEMNFYLRAANILSFATGKAAVGVLILRLMGPTNQWQRWVVWVVIVLTAIINILNCIFNFVQCRPIEANWDQELPHSCWPPRVQLDFAYFMSGENILADVILAILPATIFWNLKIPFSRHSHYRAAICGIVKTTKLDLLGGVDFTWNEYGLTLWSVSETFVIIFTGCIPTLQPLWNYIFPREGSHACLESDRSQHLSGTYFAQQQGYQMFSMASTTENSSSFRDDIHGESSQREIRTTTQIDVTSRFIK